METYDWTSWTPWCPLEGLDFKQVPSGPGAYVVSVGTPLKRVVGVDSEGMIDIGESGALRQRLKDFCRCATTKGEAGHMAGWRFGFFQFKRHFPFEALRLRCFVCSTRSSTPLAAGRAWDVSPKWVERPKSAVFQLSVIFRHQKVVRKWNS